ncbi:MAG: NADAR family protein [Gemmataceae bacterium]|nr:NADAR family protein [Gemmataceae bacterium]
MATEPDPLANFEVDQVERYARAKCAVFRKTAETWGEFSNMVGGFPVIVNEVSILTSEALYQACRFPHLPDVQREIIAQASPMAAKMKGKPHRKDSRPDFDALRVPIMWWALRVKLACNVNAFSRVLLASGEQAIVEDSHKDTFWGAKELKDDANTLEGRNVLGRLLVLLREHVRTSDPQALKVVETPDIADFHLYGQPVGRVERK